MPDSSKKAKSRNPLLIPLIVACALVLALSCVYIVQYYKSQGNIENTNRRLIDLFVTPAPTAEPAEATYAEATAMEATPVQPEPTRQTTPDENTYIVTFATPPASISPEFDALYRINPDIVGHLSVPSTTTPIDLFVVQRDNDYYLTHDFYGEPSKGGTLFLDHSNAIWPQDQHLLIYGHNMKNGTMFARLTKYKSIEYATRNPFVYFDTLYEKGAYTVVAALRMTAKDTQTEEFNLRTFAFGEASFDAFIYRVLNNALYITNAGVENSDQLLTLVTCSYSEDDERFILLTRKLREGETEEDVLNLIGSK